jgi:hypothetical protein
VFITGTISKLTGSDSFELANVNLAPHVGNGARLLSGQTLSVHYDAALNLDGLKPGVRLSSAVDNLLPGKRHHIGCSSQNFLDRQTTVYTSPLLTAKRRPFGSSFGTRAVFSFPA